MVQKVTRWSFSSLISKFFDETQVEEINGLLNTCEVPNLWKMDEYNAILEAMSKFTKAESRAAKYLTFVNRAG